MANQEKLSSEGENNIESHAEIESGLGEKNSEALSNAREFFVEGNLDDFNPEQISRALKDIWVLQREGRSRLSEQIARNAAAYIQSELHIQVTKIKRSPMSYDYDILYEQAEPGGMKVSAINERLAKQVEIYLREHFPQASVYGDDRYELKIKIAWQD